MTEGQEMMQPYFLHFSYNSANELIEAEWRIYASLN